MASSASEDVGAAVGNLVQLVVSPLFPLMFILLCGASFLLAVTFKLPQFLLFAWAVMLALEYAKANLWAVAGIGIFVVASLPMAWVAFREYAAPTSKLISHWVMSALMAAGMYWMTTAWPYEASVSQIIVFGLVWFIVWAQIFETLIGTLAVWARHRPRPGREVVESQMVHGRAAVARESEALALLKSKK